MTDITFSAKYIEGLTQTLVQIGALSPAPTPKGRYALAKITTKAIEEHTTYKKAFKEFLDDMVTKDENGKPLYEAIDSAQVKYTILTEKVAEYIKGQEDFEKETITLANVRPITHEELGLCPLTIDQERILLMCGILLDQEPI